MKKIKIDIMNSFFIANIINFLETISLLFKKSLFYSIIFNFINFFNLKINESFFIITINKNLKKILNDISKSYFYNMIISIDNFVDKSFKKSFILNIFIYLFICLHTIFNILLYPFKNIKMMCEELVKNPSIFLGSYFVFMCSIPHNRFNNLYIVILTFVCLLIYLVGEKKEKIVENLRNIHMSFYLVIIMIIMGVVISFSIKGSIKQFLFDICAVIMSFLIIFNIKKYEDIKKLLNYIALGFFIVGLYGIYLKFTGMYINSNDKLVLTEGLRIERMSSTLDNPNNLAEFILLFLPIIFSMFLNEKSKFYKALLFIIVSIGLYVLIMTYTRTAWIAFLISFLIFIMFYDFKLLPIFLGIFIFVLPFLPSTIISRFDTIINFTKDSSFKHRINIWNVVRDLIRDYGFTGIGLGNSVFISEYSKYTNFLSTKAMHSHNLILNIWVEMGIVGVFSFLWFIIRNIVLILRNTIYLNNRDIRNINIAIISSLSGIFFISLLEYIWFYPRIMVFFFYIVGIMISLIKIIMEDKKCQ